MKLTLVWVAALLAAGIIVGSLVPGPYSAAKRLNAPGDGFLQSTQFSVVTVETLRQACGNCHSNQTQWPWYSHVAPFSWLVRRDVTEGRKFLNFSLWPAYGEEVQRQLLALAAAEIQRGSMPPFRYSALHAEARLSSRQRSDLITALQQETARLSNAERSNR